MVMLGAWFHLIVMMSLIKVKFLYQPQFLEHSHGSVDSGQVETGLFLPGSAIDFVGIQVPLVNDIQN